MEKILIDATYEKGKMFLLLWDTIIAGTKKPPVGGFIESRKMLSGIYPEGEDCYQAISTTANLLKNSKHKHKFPTPVYVAWPTLQLV